MSDELAEKKEAEDKAAQEVQQKTAEEAQKRLWLLQVMFDPVTGQVGVVPMNENVKTLFHIHTVLNAALVHNEARLQARYFVQEMAAAAQQPKPKKGLFRARG